MWSIVAMEESALRKVTVAPTSRRNKLYFALYIFRLYFVDHILSRVWITLCKFHHHKMRRSTARSGCSGHEAGTNICQHLSIPGDISFNSVAMKTSNGAPNTPVHLYSAHILAQARLHAPFIPRNLYPKHASNNITTTRSPLAPVPWECKGSTYLRIASPASVDEGYKHLRTCHALLELQSSLKRPREPVPISPRLPQKASE